MSSELQVFVACHRMQRQLRCTACGRWMRCGEKGFRVASLQDGKSLKARPSGPVWCGAHPPVKRE